MILISDKKSVRKRPKYLQYSKTLLVSRNKHDVVRKGFGMAGIVEALT